MLCNFTINYTKISSHELINKREQFILNHSTKHIFAQNYFCITIHMNSKTLGLLFTITQIGIFFTRFKAFETEFTTKTSLRTFLTIYMIHSQEVTQVGKDPYLLSCRNSTKLVSTRSPRRVEQLSFLLRRKPMVRSAGNLERSHSLSL